MPKLTRILSVVALIIGGSVAGLILAEVLLRVTHLAPAAGLHTVDEAEFTSVPGMFGPSQRFVDWRLRALPHQVSINSLGYRGDEFPVKKPAEELRVLFVGDSFTYGDFVDDTTTLPALVERELAGVCRSVRVVNAGVGGTTIVTHAAMVGRAHPLDIDVVVLMFYENDVIDLRDPLWFQMEANRRRKSRFPVNLVYRSMRDLAIWNAALSARAAMRLRARIADEPQAYKAQPDIPQELKDEYRSRLRALRDSLRVANVPLFVTAYPSHTSVYRDSVPEMVDWFAATASEDSLPYVDLFEPLRASGGGPSELYLMPHDGHASPAGNRIASRVIAEGLKLLRPLEGRCRPSALSGTS